MRVANQWIAHITMGYWCIFDVVRCVDQQEWISSQPLKSLVPELLGRTQSGWQQGEPPPGIIMQRHCYKVVSLGLLFFSNWSITLLASFVCTLACQALVVMHSKFWNTPSKETSIIRAWGKRARLGNNCKNGCKHNVHTADLNCEGTLKVQFLEQLYCTIEWS